MNADRVDLLTDLLFLGYMFFDGDGFCLKLEQTGFIIIVSLEEPFCFHSVNNGTALFLLKERFSIDPFYVSTEFPSGFDP